MADLTARAAVVTGCGHFGAWGGKWDGETGRDNETGYRDGKSSVSTDARLTTDHCQLSTVNRHPYFCRKNTEIGTPVKLKCLRNWFSR